MIVLPVLFEGTVLGVIELASFQPFTQIQKDFLNSVFSGEPAASMRFSH